MNRDLEAFKFNQISASDSKGADNHNWRNLGNQTKKRTMEVVHNSFGNKKNPDGNLPTANISFTDKVYSEPSPLKMAYKKKIDKIDNFGRKGIDIVADLGAKPFLRQQVDYIKVGLGDFINRDKENAKKSYGLMFPRVPFKMFGLLNYPTTWLEAITPKFIKEGMFDVRQKMNNFFINPLGRGLAKIGKFSRKVESKFYSNKSYRDKLQKRQTARSKFRKKTIGRVYKLEKLINRKWASKHRSPNHYRENVFKLPDLAEKNKQYYDDLKDTA